MSYSNGAVLRCDGVDTFRAVFQELSGCLRKPSFASGDAEKDWVRGYPDLVRAFYGAIFPSGIQAETVGGLVRDFGETGVGRLGFGSVDAGGDESVSRGGQESWESDGRTGGSCVAGPSFAGDVGGGERSDGTIGVNEFSGKPVRGKHHEKNRQKKERKRRAKEKVQEDEERVRESLREKWLLDNRLAALRSRQAIEILEKRDLEAAANLKRTRVASQVERNLVNMEKSHSFLKSTGNVPGVTPQGFAETVVDSVPGLSKGESISPSSSISEADIRRMKKEMEDLVAERDKAVGYLREYGIDFKGCLYRDKAEWTDNSENIAVLDDLFPDGFLKHVVDEETGKFVPC